MSKYPIDPAFASIPNIRIIRNKVRLRLLSILVRSTRVFYKWGDKVVVRQHKIKASDGTMIKLLQVAPAAIKPSGPALLYYHGGGFFLTYGAGHLNSIKNYALNANCTVFFVEYRRSLDFPFPTPFDDCFSALVWVNENVQELKIDRNRIAVGGDSAGGCLAASVAQKALDNATTGTSKINLVGQLLIYPVTDCESKTKSVQEFIDTPVWSSQANKTMWELYLKRERDAKSAKQPSGDIPAYASPIHRDDFVGLPPAYVEAAEFDPLRDEANDYAHALQNAGVEVQLEFVAGAVHGYDMVKSEITRTFKLLRVEALKRFFAQ